MAKELLGKKVAMIVAFRDFRDAEYFVPKEILEEAGAEVIAVSTKKGLAIGADGGEVRIDVSISEIKPENFDAIVFVGGPGAIDYLDNQTSYNLAKETIEKDKILAAICISPVILANAGVLKGKKATVWSSPLDKNPIRILRNGGAIYKDALVVVDGKIVTANGPEAAKEFGEALVSLLTRQPLRL
jgi:protease I